MRKVKVENNNKSLFMELSNNDSIILSWDNPVDTTGAVKYNELFYHSSKDIHWTLLQSKIPYENNPKVVVHKNDIAPQDSLLYFGVRYVSNDTTYSDLHSSADSNAYPPKGWFLQWIK